MNYSNIKKIVFTLVAAALMISAMPGEPVITKNGKQAIVNTTTIAADIKGYNGPTPLKIYITNNKIDKVEALPNQETPKYFFKVKKEMLDKWNGMTVNNAINANVDGVTGATISSNCVKKTVKRGLEYYKKNK
ncbi:MAG: FMN-binding protein [Prevotella sp.]|nr:FMN-binding protein [Prevotella sp.]